MSGYVVPVVPSPSTGGVAGGVVVGSVGGCVVGSVGDGIVGSVGVGLAGSVGGGVMGSTEGSAGGVAGSLIGAGSVGGTSGGGGSLLQAVNAKAIAATSGKAMRRIGSSFVDVDDQCPGAVMVPAWCKP
ncbi:MAG: hypothetical protein ABW163_09165 [Luteimonas sp.]